MLIQNIKDVYVGGRKKQLKEKEKKNMFIYHRKVIEMRPPFQTFKIKKSKVLRNYSIQ